MIFLRSKRLEKKTSDAREPSLYRSICTSIISTLLSLVMLVGTTFAWFTDSITSNVFTIQAANVWTSTSYHVGNEELDAIENWTKLNNDSDILGGVTFSSGAEQTVYLKLENHGQNEVKYKISLFRVGNETEGLLSVGSETVDDTGIATQASDVPIMQPVFLRDMMRFEYAEAEDVNTFLVAAQSAEDTSENDGVPVGESEEKPFEILVPGGATSYVKLTLRLADYTGEWTSLPSISLKLKIVITQPGDNEAVTLEDEKPSQQQNETENATEPAEDVKKPIVTVGVDMTTEIETPAQPAAQPQQPATGEAENNAVGSNENDGDTNTAGNGEDANTVGDTTDDTNTSGAAEDGGNADTSGGAVDTAADTAAVEPNAADDAPAADSAA